MASCAQNQQAMWNRERAQALAVNNNPSGSISTGNPNIANVGDTWQYNYIANKIYNQPQVPPTINGYTLSAAGAKGNYPSCYSNG